MNQELKESLRLLSRKDLKRVLLRVRLHRLRHEILRALYRVDLWLFPPLSFSSSYLALSRFFPHHPIRLFALLASSFMASTLTLLMLRPPKRVYVAHWIGL